MCSDDELNNIRETIRKSYSEKKELLSMIVRKSFKDNVEFMTGEYKNILIKRTDINLSVRFKISYSSFDNKNEISLKFSDDKYDDFIGVYFNENDVIYLNQLYINYLNDLEMNKLNDNLNEVNTDVEVLRYILKEVD